MGDPRRLRLGVIGLGLIAQRVHLPNLAQLASLYRVDHVCDLSPALTEAIGARLPGQVRRSTDWRALAEDPGLDALLVLTPGAHGEIVAGGLAGGKHVLSEKPLCITRAEATLLDEAAGRAGRVLQVAYMKAYDPAIEAARASLAAIGSIRLVRATVRHPTDARQTDHLGILRFDDADRAVLEAAAAHARERTREALGDAPPALGWLYRDVLLGSVSHELAAMAALGLRLASSFEYARAWPLDVASVPAEPPSLVGHADLGDGTALELAWLWLPDYPAYDERITILGSAGSVELRMPQPYGPNVSASLTVTLAEGKHARTTTQASDWDSGFLRELRAFHAAVTEGGPVLTDAAGSREITASLQALAAAIARERGLAIGGEAAARGSGA